MRDVKNTILLPRRAAARLCVCRRETSHEMLALMLVVSCGCCQEKVSPPIDLDVSQSGEATSEELERRLAGLVLTNWYGGHPKFRSVHELAFMPQLKRVRVLREEVPESLPTSIAGVPFVVTTSRDELCDAAPGDEIIKGVRVLVDLVKGKAYVNFAVAAVRKRHDHVVYTVFYKLRFTEGEWQVVNIGLDG